jgi:PAS domain S-box-containing protein
MVISPFASILADVEMESSGGVSSILCGPVGVLIVDREGLVLDAEGDGLERLGVRSEDAGRSAFELWSHLPPLRQGIERALAGEPSAVEMETQGRTLCLRCEPRRRHGQAVGAMLVALDITDGRAEECKRKRELTRLFRQVPGFVWVCDRDLRITFVVGRPAPGLPRGEVVGRTVYEIMGTRDVEHPVIAHHLAALAGAGTAFRHWHSQRWFEVLIDPVRDADGRIDHCIGVAVDVTDRKLAEERLSRSEMRLQEGQRLAHFGSWEWDISRNKVIWSDELYRIYGFSKDRFTPSYESFLEHVHPDDLELVKSALFDALRAARPFHYDHRIVRPDGDVRMLATAGEVVTDERGKPTHLRGTCFDATEHWNVRSKLERAVSLLKATLEASADGLLVVDRAGKVAAHNQRFGELWRIPPELAERGDDQELIDFVLDQLEDPEGFLARVQQLYKQPDAESFDVLRFRDGRVYERLSRPQRVGDDVVGRVWSFRDATERERLLRRALFLGDVSRLFVSLDAESALDGLARLSVPFLGDACAVDLLGEDGPRRLVTVSRDPTLPPLELLHPFPAHPLIYTSENQISHLTAPLQVCGRTVGGLTFSAPSGRTYSRADLDLVVRLARRAALAMENEGLYRAAQDALHTREEFLAVAAHEIRGPITAIMLAVQSLRAGLVDATARSRMSGVIEREARRLARLVDELLDLGKLRAGQLHFQLEEVDLAEVVREVTGRLSTEVARSGSSLTIHSERVVGTWDRLRVDQVVTNLVTNAVKFGLGKPIEITVAAEAGWARLAVHDGGIGIAPDMRQRIFQPFERAVPMRQYGGLGVGLYIVRTIVDGLGGRVRIEGGPGEGSIFTVEIPQARRT